jgi:hypothetical protein
MKAIQVRYLPATNFKGSRVKAFTEGKNSIVIPFLYEISSDELRAIHAAEELISRLNWSVSIAGAGQLPNGDWAVTIK